MSVDSINPAIVLAALAYEFGICNYYEYYAYQFYII